MSTSSNLSQSTYSPSEPETPQNPTPRIQNFDKSLNHGDLGHSIEQSLKNSHKEMHQKRIQSLRKELEYLKSTEWKFEYDKVSYSYYNDADSDLDKENFLAEQLLELEIQGDKEVIYSDKQDDEVLRDKECFKRSGVITCCGDNYVLIDGTIYVDTSTCSLNLNTNDSVLYLGYFDSNGSIIVARILENNGINWGDEDIPEEYSFNIIEHILVGQVSSRQNRFVFIAGSDLKFNLDNVEGTFIPMQGDWVEMKCGVQEDKKHSDITTNQVITVMSFKPLRTKIKTSVVTDMIDGHGTCDRQIYFTKDSIPNGEQIQIGCKVMVEAIESNQGTCSWRALKMCVVKNVTQKSREDYQVETDTLDLEREKNIEITHPLVFERVTMNSKDTIIIEITNKSSQPYFLNNWIILSKKRDSQLKVEPYFNLPARLTPGQTLSLKITCIPKFYGKSKEPLIFLFKGFKTKRLVEINVCGNTKLGSDSVTSNILSNYQKCENMRNIRQSTTTTNVHGERLVKPPNFVSIKIGGFPIPEKLWSCILGDSEQAAASYDFNKIVSTIEKQLPVLIQELCIINYTNKWHTLLYMEEIQTNINFRIYDRNKVFLIRHQEYLGIEIQGLAEKRPSLIKGDSVIVKDSWNAVSPQYEGFIHLIKGNLVLMKFNAQFHEIYSGSDVSITFKFSRTVFKRMHHSINLAISNLGHDILFPSRLSTKQLQITNDKLQNIKWYNNKLNDEQKRAVINILKGECRPMPYIIFGPPGTGKTVIVVETILQVLSLLPESRLLIATPSNSASNLLTERLIQYKDLHFFSLVRVIGNYLVDSDKIPEAIKQYCATIDISKEHTSKSNYEIKDNINLNCQTSFIGRHRVTIGTCNSLGSMKHWDMPRGHFTHIIVDEAGQATEPEIMVPLTFINKEHGQIVLAGDPKQLGPVIFSKYCKEFGMKESYLCRILETFPYQKDYDAFPHGFDSRLVTKLNDNYRSLEEVLFLPNRMFYDGTLIAKCNKTSPDSLKYLTATSDIFEMTDYNDGAGIFVYGINGSNTRSEESPSWYNPQEAAMVALITCKLYKKNITVDEIGIVSPYVAQTKYIRLLFDSMGLPQPKIGSVEEFQGQERHIIIISTVRSTETLIHEDLKHSLGFLRDAKRLNVALTRAKVSVILLCNPHLLAKDYLWNQVIAEAVVKDKYTGCELPFDYTCQGK